MTTKSLWRYSVQHDSCAGREEWAGHSFQCKTAKLLFCFYLSQKVSTWSHILRRACPLWCARAGMGAFWDILPCWLSMAPRASQSHSFPSWLSWIKFLHHRMKTAIDNSKGQAHVVCHTQLDLYRYYFCLIWIQVRGGPRVPILPMEKHCSQSSKTIRLFDTHYGKKRIHPAV